MVKWQWLRLFIFMMLLVVAIGKGLPIAYAVVRSANSPSTPPNYAAPVVTPAQVAFLPAAYRQFSNRLPSPTSGPSPTAPSETVTPGPTSTPPPEGDEIIVNGNFEQGRVAWTEQAGAGSIINDGWREPYEGEWVAWFGGYTNALDILTQVVHVPTDTAYTQTLTFHLYVESTDNHDVAYDFFYLRFLDMEGNPLSEDIRIADNTNAPQAWTAYQVNLYYFNSLAGQDIQVQFEGTGDYSAITNFCIDVVSLDIITGTGLLEGGTPHLEIDW